MRRILCAGRKGSKLAQCAGYRRVGRRVCLQREPASAERLRRRTAQPPQSPASARQKLCPLLTRFTPDFLRMDVCRGSKIRTLGAQARLYPSLRNLSATLAVVARPSIHFSRCAPCFDPSCAHPHFARRAKEMLSEPRVEILAGSEPAVDRDLQHTAFRLRAGALVCSMHVGTTRLRS